MEVHKFSKENAVRMLVWDIDEYKAKERLVLGMFPEGRVRVVSVLDEEKFLAGKSFNNCTYAHAKPIPEKKWRRYKDGEIHTGMLDWYFQAKDTKEVRHPHAILFPKPADVSKHTMVLHGSALTTDRVYEMYLCAETIEEVQADEWRPFSKECE